MVTLHVSNICTAFNEKTIGTKVTHPQALRAAIAAELDRYEMPASGQGFVPLSEATTFVSGGIGHIDDMTEASDIVVRKHRGKWGTYLRREKAVAVQSLNIVVYTKEAYLADPDVQNIERGLDDASHVIVAVLAAAGPNPPMPPGTLLHNIAGGNNQYIPKTKSMGVLEMLGAIPLAAPWVDKVRPFAQDLALLHSIVKQAQESERYWSEWMVVAD